MSPKVAAALALITCAPVLAQAQALVSIVSPTNEAHFFKAVSMGLNIPLQARVTNPGPSDSTVSFYTNGVPLATAGKQNNYSTVWSNAGFGSYSLLAGIGTAPPNSGLVSIQVDYGGVSLVNENSTWKYLDGGANPGPFWFEPLFDASTWASGLPQFGFGDGDESTIVNWSNPADLSSYAAFYFRHSFLITNPAAYTNLVIRLLRDDGAIVYLNGQELFRENMPEGAINYTTYASAGAQDENAFNDHWINPARLVQGTNSLAVEIHNQSPQSHDISFDLRLIANLPQSLPRLSLERTGSNVVAAWPSAYQGYRLEMMSTLGNSGAWTPLTNTVQAPPTFRSTNSLSGTAKFFRLTLP
jgi:hypothetical protein